MDYVARPHDHRLQRLHGPDRAVRPLPRSQIRSHHAEGFLSAVRVLQFAGRSRTDSRRPRSPAAGTGAVQGAGAATRVGDRASRDAGKDACGPHRRWPSKPAPRGSRRLREKLRKPVPTTQGLLVHLPLDETATSLTEAPASPTSRPTTRPLIRGKAVPTTGPVDGALQLDGKTTIDLGKDIANFDRPDQFSFAAWIKTARQRAGDDHRPHGRRRRQSRLRSAHQSKENSKPTSSTPGRPTACALTPKNRCPPSAWHHVFVTYDGSSKAAGLKLYVDGEPIEVTVTNDTLIGRQQGIQCPAARRPAQRQRRRSKAPSTTSASTAAH